MAKTAIKPRSEFPKGPEGEASYNAPENWVDNNTITANPPATFSMRGRLIGISDEIVKTTVGQDGTPVENVFRNLDISDNKGEVITRSLNAEFFKRIGARLKEGRVYEFTFETTKEGVTTYTNAQKTLAYHRSSRENMTSFKPITERSFDEGTELDIDRIVSAGDAAGAVAEYLKTLRTADMGR